MQVPYLLDHFDPGQGEGVSVSLDIDTSAVTIAAHGSWGRELWRDARTAIAKTMSEHPATLIFDLHHLEDPNAQSVPLWMTARRTGKMLDPEVQVMVCAPPGSPIAHQMNRLGARWFMPVLETLDQARDAAREWMPLTGWVQAQLSPDDDQAAAAARTAVTDACTAWRMPDLVDRGRLVTSELVLNAAEHAGTPITLAVSRRGTALHVAVRDSDPRLPHLTDPPATLDDLPNRRGLGLHTVHAAAAAWGAIPSGAGKVVWATIRSWRQPR